MKVGRSDLEPPTESGPNVVKFSRLYRANPLAGTITSIGVIRGTLELRDFKVNQHERSSYSDQRIAG